jgi:hypothetical protein
VLYGKVAMAPEQFLGLVAIQKNILYLAIH